MKRLFLIAFIGIQLIVNNADAQVTTQSILSSSGISKTDIVGVWQFTAMIGDNLLEYFQFFKDGTFVYHYNGEDDTRNIISMKGRYFLNKNQLSFIVRSKVERTAKGIETGAMGTDEYIFVLNNDSTKVVLEKNPKNLIPYLSRR
ncbi:hypothetical protein [Mucilaginibacter dorajii]|uniref:Lipocalin-like domain-containing protein n=1 Tax=Mucilaginibacter dorajii TaxID=692994 RepID=A0ABP7PQE6_9SPHI|nr:hypothetical protein [Mucilaginibacter dorajii]MCS3736965.1 hypothetical protein [Mucilaginibacter dorajii]